jgi:predicted O-methyltransferase YrrM
MAMPTPAVLDAHMAAVAERGARLEGHLTQREVRFLALLGACPTCRGEVLEIGSYKGKSTVILATSAAFAGEARVVAVDPLDLPATTDPRETRASEVASTFFANLRAAGVEAMVEFHQTTSQELGTRWNRSLRLLWIDGDHTYTGAKSDYDTFSPYLAPGAIVAFHDVLHRYEGPPRTMIEGPLASPLYGACGVVGSIGWAQYLGNATAAAPYAAARKRLADRLAALLPHMRRPGPGRLWYKLLRARIPHRALTAAEWMARVQGVR